MTTFIKKKLTTTRSKIGTVIAIVFILILYFILSHQVTPYSSIGYIDANIVLVAPEVSGKIERIHIKNGQMVKKGQTLFSLEKHPYELKLLRAQANLMVTRARVAAAREQIKQAKASIAAHNAVVVNAKQRYEEFKKVITQDFLSLRRLQQAQEQYDSAVATLTSAKMKMNSVKSELGSSINGENIHVRKAMSDVRMAQYYLDKTRVNSPIQGRVENLHIIVGTYTKPGTQQLTIMPINNFWIEAFFTENSIRNIQVGDIAYVGLDMYPGHLFKARVTNVGRGIRMDETPKPYLLPYLKPSNFWIQQQRMFPVRLVFTELPKDIMLSKGSQANVVIKTEGSIAWFWNGLAWFWSSLWSWLHYLL